MLWEDGCDEKVLRYGAGGRRHKQIGRKEVDSNGSEQLPSDRISTLFWCQNVYRVLSQLPLK
jgi:hypothetical protein